MACQQKKNDCGILGKKNRGKSHCIDTSAWHQPVTHRCQIIILLTAKGRGIHKNRCWNVGVGDSVKIKLLREVLFLGDIHFYSFLRHISEKPDERQFVITFLFDKLLRWRTEKGGKTKICGSYLVAMVIVTNKMANDNTGGCQ